MTLESLTVKYGLARGRGWYAFLGLLVQSAKAHALIIALVLVYLLTKSVVFAAFPRLYNIDFATFSMGFISTNMPILLVALVVQRFYYIAVHVRPARPAMALAQDIFAIIVNPMRVANAIPMIAALTVFIGVFSFYKANIAVIFPFHWDMTLDGVDHALHFGHRPWELLQPILGFPIVTFILSLAYNLWFFVMWTMLVTFALRLEAPELRTRFFLSFVLVWSVGGSLLATLFSSAGPCFYGRIGLTPDPYADLMTYLRTVNTHLPIWAVKTQDLLWSGYLGKQNVIAGISAMPSMHNASTLLFALTAWNVNRKLGIVMSIYAAMILLASIHLGWHYAVDGYAGYAITLAIWGVCGPLARWNERLPWSQDFAQAIAEAG